MKATLMPAVLGLPLLIATALGTDAQAASTKSFVLQTSGTWGAAQDAAVAKAGGTITYRHAGSGIATVESSNASFLANAKKLGLNGAEDQMVQWVKPGLGEEVSAATAGDETFAVPQWNIEAVQAQEAWDAAPYTGAGVRVAVIDGGIYSSHIDIAPNLDTLHSTSFVPGFAFNQDVGTFWHGTHVAGIIAAADNGVGTIGIAPHATIVGVKALHNGTGSFGAVISAILYASTPVAEGGGGADIINMSLGALFPRSGGKPDDNNGVGQLIGAIASAVNYANDHGVLVISAAGNDATDLDHSKDLIDVPAQSGSGIAVSATGPYNFATGVAPYATMYDIPASYTNYGKSAVWVAAPGGNDFAYNPTGPNCTLPLQPAGSITRQCWVFDLVMSTVRGSGASTTTYGWAEGTSMAAPAAAAVAALIKERFPNITVGDLKTRLAKSAAPGNSLFAPVYYGKGTVNAYNAVMQ